MVAVVPFTRELKNMFSGISTSSSINLNYAEITSSCEATFLPPTQENHTTYPLLVLMPMKPIIHRSDLMVPDGFRNMYSLCKDTLQHREYLPEIRLPQELLPIETDPLQAQLNLRI